MMALMALENYNKIHQTTLNLDDLIMGCCYTVFKKKMLVIYWKIRSLCSLA